MRHVHSRPSLESHSIMESFQLAALATVVEEGGRPTYAYCNPALQLGDASKVQKDSSN